MPHSNSATDTTALRTGELETPDQAVTCKTGTPRPDCARRAVSPCRAATFLPNLHEEATTSKGGISRRPDDAGGRGWVSFRGDLNSSSGNCKSFAVKSSVHPWRTSHG